MNFIAPNFLFGLFALPIPFIIHLWYRHRLKKIWFPSISLILQAKQGEKSFRQLKNIILLILRTLALLFLVLAFASPTISRRQKIAILDDSWDMYTKSDNKTVFDKAEKVALSLKDTKILLASGKPYPSPCKYQKFYLPSKGVDYIITKANKLPHTIEAKLIEIDYEKENFSIDSLYSTPSSFIAFIRNHTGEERKRVITLNSQLLTLNSHISIPPYTTSTAIFPPLPKACAGWVKIEEEDALPLDNIRYFVYSPLPPLRVLIVGNSEEAFFLKNALSPKGGGSGISVEISPTLINPTAYDAIFLLQDYKIGRLKDYKNTVRIPVDATEVEGVLTLTISKTHPILAGFEFIDELKQIKFTHRIKRDPLPLKEAQSQVIASFSDGRPAIIEHNSRALELLFPINLQSKELILSPIFPPLMHRIVYWVAGKNIENRNFIVGETVQFSVPEFKPYQCKREGAQYIELLQPKIEPTGIYVYFTPDAPGIYEISGVSKFAVNISNSLVYPETLPREPTQVQVNIKKWFFLLVLILLTSELIIRRL